MADPSDPVVKAAMEAASDACGLPEHYRSCEIGRASCRERVL